MCSVGPHGPRPYVQRQRWGPALPPHWPAPDRPHIRAPAPQPTPRPYAQLLLRLGKQTSKNEGQGLRRETKPGLGQGPAYLPAADGEGSGWGGGASAQTPSWGRQGGSGAAPAEGGHGPQRRRGPDQRFTCSASPAGGWCICWASLPARAPAACRRHQDPARPPGWPPPSRGCCCCRRRSPRLHPASPRPLPGPAARGWRRSTREKNLPTWAGCCCDCCCRRPRWPLPPSPWGPAAEAASPLRCCCRPCPAKPWLTGGAGRGGARRKEAAPRRARERPRRLLATSHGQLDGGWSPQRGGFPAYPSSAATGRGSRAHTYGEGGRA